MKKKVAVFPCGSEVGLEVHRALKYYRHFELIGLSSVDDHGRITFRNYYGNIPFINQPGFIDYLWQIIKENNIDFIIPAMDEAGYILKKNEKVLDCEVIYPDLKIAEIIRRKSKTYEFLSQVIKVPKVYTYETAKNSLPIFSKPDIGYGSRGAKKIETVSDLAKLKAEKTDVILSEFLPGQEYTIDCFSDNDSNVIFSGARVRNRIRMGISVSTKQADQQERFKEIAEKISRKLGLKGIWFFQVKEDINSKLTLLEVASRVSGSMSYFRAKGINFIAMELFRRQNYPVFVNYNSELNGILDRALDTNYVTDFEFNTVYCDLDDCLILEEGYVNTNLLKFLFQCLNTNKKLVLLTRHASDPNLTLKKFRLDGIFDEIYHITDNKVSKSEFIKTQKAIFIDDSFAERNLVFNKLGISVFAPDAVDMLIKKGEF